jgi:hypothetical protein
MGPIVYFLCAVVALGCAVLLFRGYRRSGTRLLLWSALCFAGLALNNALTIIDRQMFPDVDLFVLRNLSALGAMMLLLYGFIWDAD